MRRHRSAHHWLWLAIGLLATIGCAWVVHASMVGAGRADLARACDTLDAAIASQINEPATELRLVLGRLGDDAAAPGDRVVLGADALSSLWRLDADYQPVPLGPETGGRPGPPPPSDCVVQAVGALRERGPGAIVPVHSDEAHASLWLLGSAGPEGPYILAQADVQDLLVTVGRWVATLATGEVRLRDGGREATLIHAPAVRPTDPSLIERRDLPFFAGAVGVAYELRGYATAWSRLRPLVVGAVLASGGAATVLGFFFLRTLGAAVQREESLRRLTQDLHERDRDIRRRRAKAEAASAAKSALLRRTSHNMRSPLTCILGLTEALISRTPPGTSRKQITAVRASARHLLDLANDLLDIARAEAGGIATSARNTDPAGLFDEVVEPFTGRAHAKSLSLSVHWRGAVPAAVFLDPTRLREILINLLDNAIRHTQRGGVGIEASLEPDSGTLTVHVTDTGEGIPPERLESLLRDDDTLGQSSPRRGTHGMGLAITRHLAAAMGGRLEIISRVGVGTTVSVHLPVSPVRMARGSSGDRAPEAPPAPDGARPVLVADDAGEVREFMRLALAQAGVGADAAASGAEAIGAARHGAYRLVFLDQHLGDVAGTELLADLRAALPDAAFVVLTGDASPEAQRRYRRAGFDALLPKPFTQDQLRELLDQHLDGRRRAA